MPKPSCRSLIQVGLLLMMVVTGCDITDTDVRIPGLVERERLELSATLSEPVVDIYVSLGDRVAKGDPILRQDDTIPTAQIRQVESIRDREAARYEELARGPRVERIAAARARLKGAEDRAAEAESEFKRIKALHVESTVSKSQYDDALVQLNDSRATREEMRAQLKELIAGTTPEELAQARAKTKEAEAAVVIAQTRASRLTIFAPADGLVEALPYKTGETPVIGATMAALLVDGPPFVRAYLPANLRSRVTSGTAVSVVIDGIPAGLHGVVRFVSSEAAYTPFFALTEHDRNRLSYLTEVNLVDEDALALPAGLPVEIFFDGRQFGSAQTAKPPE